jgi:methionyl-tRNA formyltransferase
LIILGVGIGSIPFAEKLKENLSNFGTVDLLSDSKDIPYSSDVNFLLKYEKKFIFEILKRSQSNIVVHASELSKVKGTSLLAWQIVERKNQISITLCEAVEAIDAGSVYLREYVDSLGNKLLAEMRHTLGEIIVSIFLFFIVLWQIFLNSSKPQKGLPTYYEKRTMKAMRMDPCKPIYSSSVYSESQMMKNIQFLIGVAAD